jgi:hypothetical protein
MSGGLSILRCRKDQTFPDWFDRIAADRERLCRAIAVVILEQSDAARVVMMRNYLFETEFLCLSPRANLYQSLFTQ